MEAQVLARLYELYSRELYLYIFSMCRSRELAEDIMQDTFLKALLALPEQSEGTQHLRAWLYKVARNLLFDRSRKKREVSLEEAAVNAHSASGDRIAEELSVAEEIPAGENESPPEVYLENEKKRKLFELIGQLSERKKEVLMLQYFGGLSQREIAALMHVSEANVRVLSLRARRELKQRMEDSHYDFS